MTTMGSFLRTGSSYNDSHLASDASVPLPRGGAGWPFFFLFFLFFSSGRLTTATLQFNHHDFHTYKPQLHAHYAHVWDNYSHPRPDELDAFLVIHPPKSWAQRWSRERSLRVLCLGDSNTFIGVYPRMLNSTIRSLVPDSYVLNAGISGGGPAIMAYEFENWPSDRWPNLVIMEYNVNINGLMTQRPWEGAATVEQTIRFLEEKWAIRNLPPPAFLFVELMTVAYFYLGVGSGALPDRNCSHDDLWQLPEPLRRQAYLSSLSPASGRPPETDLRFQRGSIAGIFLSAIARFRRIPMVSMIDAFWPSFVRWFTSHPRCEMYPLHSDGIHYLDAGYAIIVDALIMRLLAHAQRQTDSHGGVMIPHSVEDTGAAVVTMFPRPMYFSQARVIEEHKLWGAATPEALRVAYDDMRKMVVTDSQGDIALHKLRGHETDAGHACLGSTAAVANISFRLHRPRTDALAVTPGLLISVELGYLQSWNKSYIASMSCDMVQRIGKEEKRSIALLMEPGDVRGVRLTYSGPITYSCTLPNLPPGVREKEETLLLTCTKRVADSRLACFTGLAMLESRRLEDTYRIP